MADSIKEGNVLSTLRKVFVLFAIVAAFSISLVTLLPPEGRNIFSVTKAEAAVSVKGYYRKNGTYVKPHMRSNPDGNPYNNWSFPGNTNPYTGKVAPGNPDTYLKNYYNRDSTGGSYIAPKATTTVTDAPANSTTYGSFWFCNSGYKQAGNSCEKVIAPSNATVYGSMWFCDSGYRQVGASCEKIIAPEHATVYGSYWFCDYGYIRSGSSCVKY